MILALFGPPGSGKGTQAERLRDELHIAHISTGNLLRAERDAGTEFGRKAETIMKRGELVPDEMVGELVRRHVASLREQGRDLLFDGYPRNLGQLKLLEKILADLGHGLDLAITLAIDDAKLIERLSSRRSCSKCARVYNLLFNPPPSPHECECGGKLVHRTDDEPAAIQIRLKEYYGQTEPMLRHLSENRGLKTIDGDRPIDEVYADVLQAVKQAGPAG